MPIEVDEQNTYILLGKYTINSPLPPIEIYTKPLPSSPIRAVNYIIYGILFVIITTCDLVFYGMFINRYLGAVLCAYAAIFVVTLLTFYAIAQRRQYCLIIVSFLISIMKIIFKFIFHSELYISNDKKLLINF